MSDKARNIYDKIINSKVASVEELGTPEMFTQYVSSPDNASKIYQKLLSKGLSEVELGTQDMFVSAIVPKSNVSVKASTAQSPSAITTNTGIKAQEQTNSNEPLPKNQGGEKEDWWIQDLGDKLNQGSANIFGGVLGWLGEGEDLIGKGISSAATAITGKEYEQPQSGWFAQAANYFKQDAERSGQAVNRFDGKSISEQLNNKEYGAFASQILLEGASSLPTSIGMMIAPQVFVPATIASSSNLKYDELKEREDLSTTAKLTNAVTTGLIEAATEKLGSIPVGGWLKSLYFKGAETGTKIFKKALMDEITKLYKKYGLLLAPVGEGLEEAVGQAGENFTDWVTGATDKLDLTKGTEEAYAFGVGGGAYFTALGVPGTISNEVQRNKIETDTKRHLSDVLSYTKEGGLAEEAVHRVVSNSKNNTIEKTLEGTESAIQLIKEENGLEDVDLVDIREKLLATAYGTRKLHQYYDRQSDAELLLDYYKDKAKNDIISLADEDGNITKVTLSDGRVVDVVSGKVKVNENGQINFEESSTTLIVSDESGKRIPVQTNGSALRVESLVSQTPAQQEVENVTSVLQQKYEMETKYPVGTVVYVTDEQGNIKQNEDGTNQSSTIKDHSEDGVIIDTDQGEINLPFALAKNSLLTESDVKERLHTTFTPDTEVKSGNGEGFLYIKGIKDSVSNTYEVSMYDNNREFVDTVEMSGKDIYEFGKNKMTEMSTQNEDIQPVEDSKMTEEGEFEQKIEQITFPTKKEGGYDFAQFTPEHHYLFAAKTEGDKVANQDLKTAVYAALGNIQKQQDKINKAPFEKKAALRAELLLIKAKYNELKALEDKYIPKEEDKQGETEDIPTQQKASEQSEETQAPVINEQINKQAIHITENVKQRKQKKLNKTQQQASEIEISPSDIRANVMMYFINGGKINKSVLQQIFGSKGRNAKSIESERRLRISMLTKDENTLDSVSHKIWENMDGYERDIDTSDIRNELEDVILSYNSPVQIAKDLIENYKEKEQQVPNDLSSTDEIMTSDYESEFADETIKEIYDLCDDDQINEIFSDAYFHNEDGSINFEKLLSSLETDKVFFTNFPYELSEEQYQNIINIIRQNYDNTKTDIGRVQEKTETNNNSQSDSEGNNGIRGTGSNETRNSEQPLNASIQEQQDIEAKKADIERRRQEDLLGGFIINDTRPPSKEGEKRGTRIKVNSDGTKISFEGFYENNPNKGLNATYPKMSLEEFKNSEFYKNLKPESKEQLEDLLEGLEVTGITLQEIRVSKNAGDAIGKGNSGVTISLLTKDGPVTGINLASNTSEINAKYDAELKALEQQTKVEVEQPIKKTDKEQTSKEDKRTSDEKELDESVLSQAHNNNPTEKQKETGVYDKARINVQGYNITLETLKGQERKGIDSNGKAWAITMNNHYGELDGTIGYDGDAIDVFVGPNPKQGQIFVVDQVTPEGAFDESKVMLGFDTAEQAKAAYMSNYEEGWQGFGSITPAGDNFKQWLYDGKKQRKPFAEYVGTPAPIENSINIAESIKTDAKEIKRQELIEERKQRILSEGTGFDKKFELIPVSEIKTAAEIQANVEKIIATLKENEGNKKFDSFEGFAYGGKYAKNAGEQIREYLISIDVLPLDIRKEFAENIGVTNNDELVSWGEKKYNELNQPEQPLSVEEQEIVDTDSKIQNIVEQPKITATDEKIEDVGQKIGGAKKDLFQEYAKKLLSVTDQDIARLPLSKSFQRPNFAQLIEDGKMTQETAIFLNYFYDNIPSKPQKSYKVERWVKTVRGALDTFNSVLERKPTRDLMQEYIDMLNTNIVGQREAFNAEVYRAVRKAINFPNNDVNVGNLTIIRSQISENTYVYSVGNPIGNRVKLTGRFNTMEEAAAKLIEMAKETAGKPKQIEFSVYSSRLRGDFYITPKGKGEIVLQNGFKTSKEAFEYINENREALTDRFNAMKEIPSERRMSNRERVGFDYRQGKDVTAEDFKKEFGFRGVEFGNWVNQEERQAHINEAYDALMDLASVIGVTPRALSLNGELGFAFGSRGGGKYAAHYETDKVVINLTKTKGAGTLAHEWFHALDNYLLRAVGNRTSYATDGPGFNKEGKPALRPELNDAFRNLMKVIRKSGFYTRSAKLDKVKGSKYWGTSVELGARGFEDFVMNKLAKSNIQNDYLVNFKSLAEFIDRVNGDISEITSKYPYPTMEESETISEAYQNLFDTIQEDDNAVLFQIIGERGAEALDKAEEATIRLDNLRVAKEMEADTKTPQEIRMATGWERGVDGLWRYEIPDIKTINKEVFNSLHGGETYNTVKLQELIGEDNELLKSYPQLKGIDVARNNINAGGIYSSSGNGQITINEKLTSISAKSTLIHEIQHAIQEIEGFAKGGNINMYEPQEMFKKQQRENISAKIEKLESQLPKPWEEWTKEHDKVNGEIERLNDEKLNLSNRNVQLSAYRHLAGETEARNASARMNMSEEERRQTLLSVTADVAPEDQIILMDSVGISQHTGTTLTPTTPEEVADTVEQLLKTGLAKEVRMVKPEEIAGILEGNEQLHAVYHGSPHSFDQFSLDHIGTGEGSQAYGWGLYFTDKKEIAEDYANNLRPKIKFDDRFTFILNGKKLSEKKRHFVRTYFDSYFENLNDLKKRAEFWKKEFARDISNGYYDKRPKYIYEKDLFLDNLSDEILSSETYELIDNTKTPTNLYAVELHEGKDPSEYDYLRWDKEITPIQLEKIQSLYQKQTNNPIGIQGDLENDNEIITGESAYAALRWLLSDNALDDVSDKEVSLFLLRAGIDGIQYPANFTTGKANGTDFNYVVFDSRAITIKEKVQFMRTPTGTIYGFVKNGIVYLNINTLNLNTPIHEFGHLWIDAIEGTELYKRGTELVKNTPYWERVNADPNYSHLSENARVKEAMAMAIGDKGEAVKRNLGLFVHIKKWIADVWKTIGAKFGIQNLTPEQIEKLTFEQFTDIAVSELLSGESLTSKGRQKTKLPATIDVDGIQRPTTNSNGKPIHSTEEGIRNFWRWFGNSKVTDESGQPLIVYHGTNAEFNKFEKQNIGKNFKASTLGFYFSKGKEPNWAEGVPYGSTAKEYAQNAGGERVISVYLNIKNPLEIDADGWYSPTTAIDKQRSDISRWLNEDKSIDGVISVDKEDGITDGTYVVFSPTQIKSATGNFGSFDPNNADIRYQIIGEQETQATIYVDGEKEKVDLNEVSDMLYKLNKIAKAYGNTSTNNYRLKKPEIQQKYYDLKSNIINKYGVYETTHKTKGGVSNLYRIANNTFHDFVSIDQYVKSNVNSNVLDYSYIGYDNAGLYLQSIYGGNKYRFPLTEKQTEYPQLELDKINNFINKYNELEFVEPPKNSDTEISEKEEKSIYEKLLTISERKETPATDNDGSFDGENANILFEPQQLFIDFTKNEIQDETRKAHGNEKNQQESVIETINNATLLPTNGAIASVSRHTSKRRSIVSSKRTVIDGFRESGYVNFNGTQVNTHQDIADLWSVHRSPYIEKTHIIFLKDGVVVGTMAHTAGKIDTAPIASVNEITDYAAQLGATQIYMLHNHPSGNPTPSLQDVKVTYHIADRLREYGINLLGQVIVDHDKYSFIDTANKPLIENLNESSLEYALQNNTEYHEYKSEKTDFLLERELIGRKDPQQWLFEYGKKLLSQPEYKAVVVYLSTDPSGKGFVVSAYDALAENTSKEEILSIINEGLNENIGRHAVIIHDGSIKGGFGKVHAKLLDIISIQTGGFANDFVNEEVSYGEKQALWISEQQNYQYANEERALAYKDKVKQGVKQEMLNATLSYPEYVEIDHVEEPNIIPERPVYVKGESAYEYMQKLKEYEDNLHAVDSGIKEAYQEALANTYSKTQQLKRAHIDEVSPIEQLNDFIRKQGGEINADADAYIDYFNSKGRATYFTTKFDTEYMQKLVDTFVQVRKSGELDAISAKWADTGKSLSNYEKMHVYLQAKDIEEGIALGLVDRGESGFTNSIGITHTEYIAMFENSVSKEHIDAMWKAVNDATRFSLDYQLNADMISKETYDKFTKRQYYVPQREWSERERDERPLDYVKRGGGDNPFNAALRKAKGRKSLASDPLPFIQSIAHSSILSAEKNRTKQAMLKTVKANIAIGRKTGAFDFKQSWLINSKTTDADGNMLYDIVYTLPSAELFAEDRETRKEINKLTKQMLEETDTDIIDKLNEKIEELKRNINIATFEVHDNYIRNRTSEEKKQHEVVVISNGDRFVIQFQDEKVANAINRNFNKQTYDNVVMTALNIGARYMSAILTQYNPVFALWNFEKDYQTAIISHAIDFGAEYEARFLENTSISQKAINDYVWKGKFTNSKTGKDLELFFETGAATGWSYLFRIEQLKRNLKNQIDPSVIRSIYNGTTLPFTVMAKAFSNITEVSELSTRFATFKTSIEMGYSPKEAASHAKEVTVNFDRSGSSKFFSGIYSFFNAQIQGTYKQYRQLTRTKRGKYAIPAVAFAFFIGGVVNALLSPDDPDEERAWAEYDRMNNMLVGNVKIPLTHLYRTFWGMGTQAVLAYKGEKSVEVAMFDGTSNMLSDLFPQTPLSLWELLDENKATGKLEPDLRKYLQTIAPTATVPMVDVMLNKTFTGAPVAREPFSTKAKEYIPDSQLYKRNVHAFFKGATDTWFTKHGGDIAAKTKGNVPWYGDINPSKVQHIAEGYTGGVGKQLLDLTNFIYGIAKEGVFDETKIPVWNRLVKPYREDKVVAQKYWTLKNKVEYYEQSYNAYRKARAEGSSLSDEKVQQMRDSEKHQLYLEAKTKLHQMDRMMKSERVPSSQDIKELDAYIKQWNKLK